MMTLTFRWLHQDVVTLLQLLIVLNISLASPLTPNAESSPSRDIVAASADARSTRLIPPRLWYARWLNDSTPSLTSLSNPPHVLTYEVPMTNVAVEFFLYDDRPLNRVALRLAIKSGQRSLREHLAAKGDDWLSPTHNPFISFTQGQCFLRIDSLAAPNGRLRMTYKTLLAIYDAFLEVFVIQRNEIEAAMRMRVADITVGHGAATLNNPAPNGIKDATSFTTRARFRRLK
ncbi:MAG: hypothetical protein Q9223_000956 [Gallowayella weberi]